MHDRHHDGHPIQQYSIIPGVFGSRPAMLRFLTVVLGLLGPMVAQDVPRSSECMAMAEAQPRATPVSLRVAAPKPDEVAITYAGHSTYYIDTPGGVRIATDYN